MIAVALDALAKTTTNLRLPPLTVGMGMYLSAALTLMIPIGAFSGGRRLLGRWSGMTTAQERLVKRRTKTQTKTRCA